MRFSTMFVPKDVVTIPDTLFSTFSSLVSDALAGFNLEGEPYTFSLRLNSGVSFQEGKLEGVRFIMFRFSTGNEDIFNTLIDEIIRIKDRWEEVVVGDAGFRVGDIKLDTDVKLKGEFITLSPVVVDVEGRFLLPADEEFQEGLKSVVAERMERIVGLTPSGLSVKIAKYETVDVVSSRGKARGFVGSLELKADRETLKFIYDYGLGSRTTDGFGMLEVNN